MFTIRNGKTVRAEMHGDTALMERVFGKKELAAGLSRRDRQQAGVID